MKYPEVKVLVLTTVASFLCLCGSSADDAVPPKVVATTPANGAMNVDPALKEISVTFNEPMMDNSWSWCYEKKELFPEITGTPYYTKNFTKNVLPVKLKANTDYIIWINTVNFKGFKDEAGNSSKPYKFTFKTR